MAGVFAGFGGSYTDPTDWSNRSGYLFFLSVAAVLNEINSVALTFPGEREVFLKENSSPMYSVPAYFFTKNLIELPNMILFPLLAILMQYWLVGLSNTSHQFFTTYLVVTLAGLCGNSLGFMIGSVISDAKVVFSAVVLTILPMIIFSGFFKNSANIPAWTLWIKYISPFNYGWAALMFNEVSEAKHHQTHPTH